MDLTAWLHQLSLASQRQLSPRGSTFATRCHLVPLGPHSVPDWRTTRPGLFSQKRFIASPSPNESQSVCSTHSDGSSNTACPVVRCWLCRLFSRPRTMQWMRRQRQHKSAWFCCTHSLWPGWPPGRADGVSCLLQVFTQCKLQPSMLPQRRHRAAPHGSQQALVAMTKPGSAVVPPKPQCWVGL